MTDPTLAQQALTDDPMYRYRGCGPDEENPRMCAGDPEVSVDAWAPYTGDGAEPQRDRIARERAAVEICGWCPVKSLCAVYANTETADGHLTEPEGIWGGELPLERHRALIARRTADRALADDAALRAVLDVARTPQKRALLLSLARETDMELVAYRAGMDVRTANWHRSALVSLLGMDKRVATRDELLAAALRHNLLPASTRVRPDGRWPIAAAPTTDGARQRRLSPGRPVQLVFPGYEHLPRRPRPLPHVRGHATPGLAGPQVAGGPERGGTGRPRLRLVQPPVRIEHLTLPHLTALEPAA